jgi:hypothetical protein
MRLEDVAASGKSALVVGVGWMARGGQVSVESSQVRGFQEMAQQVASEETVLGEVAAAQALEGCSYRPACVPTAIWASPGLAGVLGAVEGLAEKVGVAVVAPSECSLSTRQSVCGIVLFLLV